MADKKTLDLANYLANVKLRAHLLETCSDQEDDRMPIPIWLLRRMIADVEKQHAEPKPAFVQTEESYTKTWGESIRAKYAHVEGIVEATNEEQHLLWERYCYRPEPDGRSVTWKQGSSGELPCAGRFGPNHEFEVYVSMSIDVVDGHNILFYHPTSLYVDHDIVREFIKNVVPASAYEHRADAANFFNVINALDREQKAA